MANKLIFLLLFGLATASSTYLPNGCPEDFSTHLLPHESNCRQYYLCSNGEKHLFHCPALTLFDFELQGCDWEDNVNCQEQAATPNLPGSESFQESSESLSDISESTPETPYSIDSSSDYLESSLSIETSDYSEETSELSYDLSESSLSKESSDSSEKRNDTLQSNNSSSDFSETTSENSFSIESKSGFLKSSLYKVLAKMTTDSKLNNETTSGFLEKTPESSLFINSTSDSIQSPPPIESSSFSEAISDSSFSNELSSYYLKTTSEPPLHIEQSSNFLDTSSELPLLIESALNLSKSTPTQSFPESSPLPNEFTSAFTESTQYILVSNENIPQYSIQAQDSLKSTYFVTTTPEAQKQNPQRSTESTLKFPDYNAPVSDYLDLAPDIQTSSELTSKASNFNATAPNLLKNIKPIDSIYSSKSSAKTDSIIRILNFSPFIVKKLYLLNMALKLDLPQSKPEFIETSSKSWSSSRPTFHSQEYILDSLESTPNQSEIIADSSESTSDSAETVPDQKFLSNGCPVNMHIHLLLPHEKDCTKFYQCTHGNKVLKQCPAQLHFDIDLQVCNWPKSVDCSLATTTEPAPTTTTTTQATTEPALATTTTTQATTEPAPTTTTTTQATTESTETETTEPDTSLQICPEGYFGNAPHPERCDAYYLCSGWQPILLFCPKDMEFDAVTKVCVKKAEGGCTWHQTSTSTTTESSETVEITTENSTAENPVTTDITTETYYSTTADNAHPQTTSDDWIVTEITDSYGTTQDTETTPQICPDNFYGNVAHPDRCDAYYLCSGWAPILLFCPNGFEFDPVLRVCVMQAEGGCTWHQNSTSTTTDSSMTTEIITESSNTTSENPATIEITTESTNATTGNPVTTESQNTTTEYPVTTESTTEKYNSTTDQNSNNTTADFTLTPTYNPETTTDDWIVTEITDSYGTTQETETTPQICPDNFYGTVAHPDRCDAYYLCSGWAPILLFCPNGFEFDPVQRVCVMQAEGGCTWNQNSTSTTIDSSVSEDITTESTNTTSQNPTTVEITTEFANATTEIPVYTELANTTTQNPVTIEITTEIVNATTENAITTELLNATSENPTTIEITTELANVTTGNPVTTELSNTTTENPVTIEITTETYNSTTDQNSDNATADFTLTPTYTTDVTTDDWIVTEITDSYGTTQETETAPQICPDNFYGNVAHPDRCDAYYLCSGWAPILLFCPNGFEFDPVLKVCVTQAEGGCTWHQNSTSTTTESSTTVEIITESTNTTSENPTTIQITTELANATTENPVNNTTQNPVTIEITTELANVTTENPVTTELSNTTSENPATIEITTELANATTDNPVTTEFLNTTSENPATIEFTTELANTTTQNPVTIETTTEIANATTDNPGTTELSNTTTQNPVTIDTTTETYNSTTDRNPDNSTADFTFTPTTTTKTTTDNWIVTEITDSYGTTQETETAPQICPDNYYGNVAHPDRCDAYYLCSGWAPILLFCPNGFEFDPVLRVCVRQAEGGCTWHQTFTSTTTDSSVTVEITTESKNTTYENPATVVITTESANATTENPFTTALPNATSENPTTVEITTELANATTENPVTIGLTNTTTENPVTIEITTEPTNTTFENPTTIANATTENLATTDFFNITTEDPVTIEITTELANATSENPATIETTNATTENPITLPNTITDFPVTIEITTEFINATTEYPVTTELPNATSENPATIQITTELVNATTENPVTTVLPNTTTENPVTIEITTETYNSTSDQNPDNSTSEFTLTPTYTTENYTTTEHPDKVTEHTTTTDENDASIVAPICPDGYYGAVADPNNCQGYYLCSGWNPIPLFCPSGYEFNPEAGVCVPQSEGGCTWLQTTSSTTTEQSSTQGNFTTEILTTTSYEKTTWEPTTQYVTTTWEPTTQNVITEEMTETIPETTENSTTDMFVTESTATNNITTILIPTTNKLEEESTETIADVTVTTTQVPSPNPTTNSPESTTNTLETTTSVLELTTECPDGYFGLVADPTDCTAYFMCSGWMAIPLRCPSGFEFDTTVQVCVQKAEGGCTWQSTSTVQPAEQITESVLGDIIRPQGPDLVPEVKPEPVTVAPQICPPGFFGMVQNPDDCTAYFLCSGWAPIPMICPGGFEFNPIVEKCVQSSGLGCRAHQNISSFKDIKPASAFYNQLYTPRTSKIRFQNKLKLLKNGRREKKETAGVCPPGFKGVQEDFRGCDQFFLCSGDEVLEMNCSSGAEFNAEIGQCVPISDNGCTARKDSENRKKVASWTSLML